MRDDDNQDIMKAFFGGNLKEQINELEDSRNVSYDELGYGINIQGNKHGSFDKYYSSLSSGKQSEIYLSNTRIDMLMDTDIDISANIQNMSVEDIIKNDTDKFKSGEIPKLLIVFHNLINERDIYVEWKHVSINGNINISRNRGMNTVRNKNETVVLTQFYTIPSAYSNNYNWWDTYGILFIGPENIKPGTYYIDMIATDKKRTLVGVEYRNVTNSSKSTVRFLVN